MAQAQGALQLLQAAITTSPDSDDQAFALETLRNALEEQPAIIPVLWSTLLSLLETAGKQMKNWLVALMDFAICRNPASVESRTQLVLQSLDAIIKLLSDAEVNVQKSAIQCFTMSYPLLFRHACGTTSDGKLWEKVISGKILILQMWRSDILAVKLASMKFVQRVIQTQSKAAPDPRLHKTDPNLGHCPSHHPFLRISVLEEEAKQLLVESVTGLYTSKSPDTLTAIVNCLVFLGKSRPVHLELIIQSLTNWTPDSLNSHSAAEIKSVEKCIKIGVGHLLRTGHVGNHQTTVNAFLVRQIARMDAAAAEAKATRDAEASKKRQMLSDELTFNKRRKLNRDTGEAKSLYDILTISNTRGNALAQFDVTAFPVTTVTELVLATLQNITDERLHQVVQVIRDQLGVETSQGMTSDSRLNPLNLGPDEEEEMRFKTEPVDISTPSVTEDMLDRPASGLFARPFKTQMPFKQTSAIKVDISKFAVDQMSTELRAHRGNTDHNVGFWVCLISRLATRVPNESNQDVLRDMLFEFLIGDISARMEFARLWLNEEWYSTEVSFSMDNNEKKEDYFFWLTRLLYEIKARSSNQDKEFIRFLSDLPEIPAEEIQRLTAMCTNADQMQLGFTALRDLCLLRPTVRYTALDALLSLALHRDKTTRNAAILTLKRWVPDISPLNDKVVQFALDLFTRLQNPTEDSEPGSGDEATCDETSVEAVVVDGKIMSDLPYPKKEVDVVCHVELLFALSSKRPDLLEHVFASYPTLSSFCKTTVLGLITNLVRSLGPRHPQILKLIQHHPVGSEDLALRLLTILTEKGRPQPILVNLIREMSLNKELDPRFLVPIISEFDMAETMKQLPRIVSLLDGTAEKKALVRSVFESVIAAPTQTFGTLSTNVPRVRQNDHLTPKELLMVLHTNEKEIGLKSTMEAIALCFSITEIFKNEVWAAFMQQVLDEPTPLPTLFLRTVIQAVQYYRQLQPFVSTTLLSRLITKKIWSTPQLWEGFIRCASAIAPHSFGALLQLPKEQLKEVVTKQGNLKKPLREYVVKKAGNNQGRVIGLLELLGDDDKPSN